MLPRTPLYIAIDKQTHQKTCQKIPIKTLPKTPPTFSFQKKTISNISSKKGCKSAVQKAGRCLFPRKVCTEKLVLMFLYRKTNEITEKFRILKKTVSKSLSKKVSYTEVAYNTVETSISRKKSNSRGSSYNHRTKNLPKTPLEFAFEKRPYPNIL